MLNINRVMLTGRLTRDPETKYLPSGTAVTNLGVAVSRPFKDKGGEWREEVAFVDVEVWGKTAERIAETGRKGQPVYVEGRLKQDSWERDGQKQSRMKVSADIVKTFDVPQRGQQGSGDYKDSNQQSSSSPSSASSQPRPASSQNFSDEASSGSQPRPASSAPSDGLHFDNDSNVSDDVPF